MGNRGRIFLVLLTILFCIGSDQLTKEYARTTLKGAKPSYHAGGLLRLDYNVNKSAEFMFE